MTEKRYNVWDIDGTIFLEDHKEGSYHIGQVGNVDINCLIDIANRLNDLTDENEHIKHTIKEAYNNERTQLGKSVLKQLLEAIQ